MDYLINNARNQNVLTKFLSIEEQKQLETKGLKFILSDIGDERKRAYIYQYLDDFEFNIKVIKINYNQKFYHLKHSMVLGALMGLGITRDCIGDIIVTDVIYIIVIADMVDFIVNNLQSIDKASVSLEVINNDDIKDLDYHNYYQTKIIVTSLRLDVIVSSLTNLSREKAKTYIQLKNVKINGVIKEQIDYQVRLNDLISIHRFGRTILNEIVKKTKKDKFVLLITKTK